MASVHGDCVQCGGNVPLSQSVSVYGDIVRGCRSWHLRKCHVNEAMENTSEFQIG